MPVACGFRAGVCGLRGNCVAGHCMTASNAELGVGERGLVSFDRLRMSGQLRCGKFCRVGRGLRGLVSAKSGFLPSSFDRLRMK